MIINKHGLLERRGVLDIVISVTPFVLTIIKCAIWNPTIWIFFKIDIKEKLHMIRWKWKSVERRIYKDFYIIRDRRRSVENRWRIWRKQSSGMFSSARSPFFQVAAGKHERQKEPPWIFNRRVSHLLKQHGRREVLFMPYNCLYIYLHFSYFWERKKKYR